MKNQKRNRYGARPAKRCLRVEPLELRLLFAMDAIPIEVGSSLRPVKEMVTPFDVQSMSFLPNATTNSLRGTLAVDEIAVMGLALALVEDVVPGDLGFSTADTLLSDAQDSVFVGLSIEQIEFEDHELAWYMPVNMPLTLILPLDISVIDGMAIPVGEFYYDFEEDVISVTAPTAVAEGVTEVVSITLLPRFEQGVIGTLPSSSMMLEEKLANGLIVNYTSDYPFLQTLPPQIHQQRGAKLTDQPGSFHHEDFRPPSITGQSLDHYETLDEMLQRNEIELATEPQLPIEKKQEPTSSNSRGQETEGQFTIEIAQTNTTLPNHTLPEGMLAIGGEVGIKAYRNIHKSSLNEDFVAQTALICDDLMAVWNVDDISTEPLAEVSPIFNTTEQLRWVAIGGTVIITYAGLLARDSRESGLMESFWVKWPKFKKHVPIESL